MSSTGGVQASQPARAVDPPAKQSGQPASAPGTIKDSIQLSPEAQKALAGGDSDSGGDSH
jgi:hypothetical protein